MSRWNEALVRGRGRERPAEELRSWVARRSFDDTVSRRERRPCASRHGREEGEIGRLEVRPQDRGLPGEGGKCGIFGIGRQEASQ